jgi:nucleoside 2-deoxyribosyltransferase
MKTFYLAHNFYTRRAVRKWELMIEKKYNLNLDNPFYDTARNDVEQLDKLKDRSPEQKKWFVENNTPERVDLIVEDDLQMIRKSDGLVAEVNDTRIGTPMEIIMAYRIFKIPVYVITRKYNNHPWIKKHSTKIFKNRKEFEQFVEKEFGLKKGLK